MKKTIVALVVCSSLAAVLGACSLPDVKDLNLSSCNETCNTQSQTCFDNVNDAGTQCLDQDSGALTEAGVDFYKTCGEDQIKAGEDCVHTLVSCIDQCIQQAQDLLKK